LLLVGCGGGGKVFTSADKRISLTADSTWSQESAKDEMVLYIKCAAKKYHAAVYRYPVKNLTAGRETDDVLAKFAPYGAGGESQATVLGSLSGTSFGLNGTWNGIAAIGRLYLFVLDDNAYALVAVAEAGAKGGVTSKDFQAVIETLDIQRSPGGGGDAP
jgi:hypothetical protein